MSRIAPLDKTIVSSLKTVLADINIRSRVAIVEVASKIPENTVFNNLDINISSEAPYAISGVKAFLLISTHEPLHCTITEKATGEVNYLRIDKLFAFHGASDSIFTILPHNNLEPVRVNICFA